MAQYRKARNERVARDKQGRPLVTDFSPDELYDLVTGLAEKIKAYEQSKKRDMEITYMPGRDGAELVSTDKAVKVNISYQPMKYTIPSVDGRIIVESEFKAESEADEKECRGLLELIQSEGYILKL